MDFARRSTGVTRGSRQAPRLLEQVRERLRVKHYSLRTEQAYVGWIRRFILANGKRHPRDMGGGEVEAFLTRLATRHEVAAGTQNQALAALLFLYREVLGVDLPWLENVVRAKRPRRDRRGTSSCPIAKAEGSLHRSFRRLSCVIFCRSRTVGAWVRS